MIHFNFVFDKNKIEHIFFHSLKLLSKFSQAIKKRAPNPKCVVLNLSKAENNLFAPLYSKKKQLKI